MTSKGPVVVKHIPEKQGKLQRGLFLDEVKDLVGQAYRPRLILDLPAGSTMKAETIDLLLECVEEVEHVDGRVLVSTSDPQAAIILELTRLTSVLDFFPSLSQAMGEVSSAEVARGQFAA